VNGWLEEIHEDTAFLVFRVRALVFLAQKLRLDADTVGSSRRREVQSARHEGA
jgi:hypothetical protein